MEFEVWWERNVLISPDKRYFVLLLSFPFFVNDSNKWSVTESRRLFLALSSHLLLNQTGCQIFADPNSLVTKKSEVSFTFLLPLPWY